MSSTTMEEPSAQEAAKLDDNPLKRKSAPELSPESPKRTRTDPDGAAAEHREPPKRSVEEARARVAQEEKRRGMRLFGGLLGTLSQRQANPAQQQKRLEIERRQQERLRVQREVEERALEEMRAAREEMRGRESIKWEEQVVSLLVALFEEWVDVLTRCSYMCGTRRCGPRLALCGPRRAPRLFVLSRFSHAQLGRG